MDKLNTLLKVCKLYDYFKGFDKNSYKFKMDFNKKAKPYYAFILAENDLKLIATSLVVSYYITDNENVKILKEIDSLLPNYDYTKRTIDFVDENKSDYNFFIKDLHNLLNYKNSDLKAKIVALRVEKTNIDILSIYRTLMH